MEETHQDAEINAMSSLLRVLEPLSDDQRARVLQWAALRYELTGPLTMKQPRRAEELLGDTADSDDEGLGNGEDAGAEFEIFAELYDKTRPKYGTEKVLVGGYWFQVVK